MRILPVIIVLAALALFMAPALADTTIPIDKDYTSGNGMVIHFDKVVIADDTHGNTFSPDPANTTWYDLYFTYENKGSTAQNGHLEVSFYDNEGNKYPSGANITDMTMDMLQPGTSSGERLVEAAILPKNTQAAGFQVYDNFQTIRFGIAGGRTSTTGGTSAMNPSASSPFCLTLTLPVLIVGAIAISKIKR
jgi:hypothetical protein